VIILDGCLAQVRGVGDDLLGLLQYSSPRGCQNELPIIAIIQLDIQEKLELAYPTGHRRLSCIQHLGGPAETAQSDQPHEGLEEANVQGLIQGGDPSPSSWIPHETR
jgi:hypothetical protein